MVLVRPVETPETIGGGQILLTERTRQDMTSHQMEVLTVGPPQICDDASCERPHGSQPRSHVPGITAGNWVLVAHRSLSQTDEEGIFICSQDAVIARLCA